MAAVNRFPFSGVFDIPKTSSGNPPNKLSPSKGYGDYCLRAQNKLYHNGEEVITFTGYDRDFSIIEEIENVCERYKKKRDGTVECTEVKLFFMGSRPRCDGEINVEFNLR